MSEKFSEEAFRETVKQNYDFSQWAGQTKEGDRGVKISGFAVPSRGNVFAVVEKEDLSPSRRQDRVTRYVCVSPADGDHRTAGGDRRTAGGNRRIVATVFECTSVEEAHETLIDVVMTYMAPKLPRCETKALTIGDICFGSHGDVNLSVIFARFNILVEVKSATPEGSVDEFAKEVDSLILNQHRAGQPG